MTSPSDLGATAPPPNPDRDEVITAVRTQERRAFGFLALFALAALVRLALPVRVGLFLGALLAFTLEPIYRRLRSGRVKPRPAALVGAGGATTVVSSTVLGLTTLLVTRGMALLAILRAQLAPGGALRMFAEHTAARLTSLSVADVSQRLESQVVSLGSRAAGIA